MEAAQRHHAFDQLKAVAIVAVVLTHAGPDSWFVEGDRVVWFLTKSWTVFHVPTFLLISGFLYARPGPVAPGIAAARFLRVLLPYMLWSCAAQLSGLSGAVDARDVAVQLLTASSLGVYYYVMLICGCILLVLPLSRLDRRAAAGVWLVYTAYAIGAAAWPGWRTGDTLFWLMREPLQLYAFGFFLSGWLAALWWPELAAFHRRRPFVAVVASSLLATVGLLLVSGAVPWTLGYFDRAIYTFGVVTSAALLLSGRPVGRLGRFLADATLGIYLSHFLFILALRPWVAEWADAPRVAALAAAGLAGGVGACALARAVLGRERAARWLGA